jgi:nucleoid-associated protein YgaU
MDVSRATQLLPKSEQPAIPPSPPAALPAAAPRATEARQKAPHAWKWLVRSGDTLFKACKITYGSCDDRAMRAVLESNPQLGPSGRIHKGQVITMPVLTPDSVVTARSN